MKNSPDKTRLEIEIVLDQPSDLFRLFNSIRREVWNGSNGGKLFFGESKANFKFVDFSESEKKLAYNTENEVDGIAPVYNIAKTRVLPTGELVLTYQSKLNNDVTKD